ncbi:unknown [Mycoplasma sp. CAG:776]|nr:unknown [Mycoplasma sp. CAG:776]
MIAIQNLEVSGIVIHCSFLCLNIFLKLLEEEKQ